MPKYLAPGTFVEEVGYRAKAIEGVPTGTAGFVGATAYGPVDGVPTLLTSLAEFERMYGGNARLVFGDGVGACDNYMWNAVRAFFAQGGKRLYVARAFTPAADDGRARAEVAGPAFGLAARHPGKAGNGSVTFTFALGPDRLTRDDGGNAVLGGAVDGDVVHVGGPCAGFRLLRRDEPGQTWRLTTEAGAVEELQADYAGTTGIAIRTLTVAVAFAPDGMGVPAYSVAGLPLDPRHRSGSAVDSPFARFAPDPAVTDAADALPIVLTAPDVATGLTILNALRALYDAGQPVPDRLTAALLDRRSKPAQRSVTVRLAGGNDGLEPAAAAYVGTTDSTGRPSGLVAFEALEDIAIVAAPGATRRDTPETRATIARLIGHCEQMRFRIAVIDSIKGQSIAEVRALRARYDSSHAALYYPWVTIVDPVTGLRNVHPPSGFVAGIYARNDSEHAVWKAPANEVVRLATGFETMLNKAQQDVLNPEGINCFRLFEGRGMRLWGARTMSSDPEWTYVNLRRTFAYLQGSIERGTRWAAFESNGERLWSAIRTVVGDFLHDAWRNGAMPGDTPESAFFVRCDRTTMSQNDLDNGRVVCLVGVAPLRPAEFVLFRIGQWTADRR